MSNEKEQFGLDEFFAYKNRFMGDILMSDKVIPLLVSGYNPSNPPNPGTLVYKQVYPWEYVPDTVEHAMTYICVEVDIREVSNKTFLSPLIYVWVFTHTSLLRLPDGSGVRTDRLTSEIVKILNGSRYYGLGELNLSSVRRYSPSPDHQGRTITFATRDFNRANPTGKPVPSNRRKGV